MTDYRKLTYNDAKIQVDSAVRDGNGVKIDTNYQRKPAVYERTTNSSTSTICTLIQFNATDYKANGYLAHFRFRVRSKLQDAYPSDNEFSINYSYRTAMIVLLNNKTSASNDIVQTIYAYLPNNDSYIDTGNYFIAFTTGRASTNFIVEILEADVPYTVPATMSASTTTNTIAQSFDSGRYTGLYPLMWTGLAVGNITGNSATATTLEIAGSASNTTLPTTSNVTMYQGSILSSAATDVWIIETYLSGSNYGFQRATSLADASNVCVRTRNNSATWGDWTYSYAVWKV